MTTRVVGSASLQPTRIRTITVPSAITTSIHSLDGLQAAQLVRADNPPTPAQIVTGNVTMIPDAPGFSVMPPKLLPSAVQFDAVRSAANNTAAAYGLDRTYAADAASIEQLTVQRSAIKVRPPLIVEQVIIPP